MAFYKYFTPTATLRFLSSLALRVTPPDQFNDPFEMRPPVDFLTGNDVLTSESLAREVPRWVDETLKQHGKSLPSAVKFQDLFGRFLVGEITSTETDKMIKFLPVSSRSSFRRSLPQLKVNFRNALAEVRQQIPMFTDRLETALHQAIPKKIGVLCMSQNENSPLMWAHYADEHRGAVVEFDGDSLCFNRRRNANDEFGHFQSVMYSEIRPTLCLANGDDTFRVLALTKASEWRYEDEVRFLWPLEDSDVKIEPDIHLLKVPLAAIRSITLGCRADADFRRAVLSHIESSAAAKHIRLRMAELDRSRFVLNYR